MKNSVSTLTNKTANQTLEPTTNGVKKTVFKKIKNTFDGMDQAVQASDGGIGDTMGMGDNSASTTMPEGSFRIAKADIAATSTASGSTTATDRKSVV